MAILEEAKSSQGGAPALAEGLRTLALNEEIPFSKYIRKVLPLDGYVFWLKTETALIAGSIHISAIRQQLEDELITVNRVIFTTPTKVEQFVEVGPDILWVGEYGGQRFAFASRGPYYKASDLYHYAGDALNPAVETQLVEVGEELSDRTLIVSNSLPLWLQLVDYTPIWLAPLNPQVMLYPSFLVPQNLPPPYGSVQITPSETRALQAVPNYSRHTFTQHQLARDLVRVTLYGLTNDQAFAFLNLVLQYSLDWSFLGLMAPSVIRDEKRTQPELGVLAMKKTIEFEVSYNMASVSEIARKLVKQASETFLPQKYGVT